MTSERRPPERPTLSGVMLIDLIKCSFLLTCPPDSFDHLGASCKSICSPAVQKALPSCPIHPLECLPGHNMPSQQS
ncbi:hypothetical protein MHYP_G00364960 [Metynnis hypsauchen]